MEGQVTGTGDHSHRHRVRVRRKPTLGEKIKKALVMPTLKRPERNQRLALVGVILLMGLYLLILRPLADLLFPETPKKAVPSAPASSGKSGLRPKK